MKMKLIPIKMPTTCRIKEGGMKTPVSVNSYLSFCQQSKNLTWNPAGEGLRRQYSFAVFWVPWCDA